MKKTDIKEKTAVVDQSASRRRIKKRNAFIVVGVISVIVVVLGVFAGGYLSRMINDPHAAFATPEPIAVNATPNPYTPAPGETEPPPTEDPYDTLSNMGDDSIMNSDIINIMLIGVDYEDARQSNWYGKEGNAFHSDVMMVLAVNTKEGRADLISFPRDTYVEIPGVGGIYKMNASLNCGKNELDQYGFNPEVENNGPFKKVCQTAEWMLGGVAKIDYYYAVTMPALKQIVDIVGPIWYDVEARFDNGKRYYQAGPQWMDGQAVLDYVRVRKPGHGGLPTGDQHRADRQRRMMVAILDQMKSAGTLVKLPQLMRAFEGQLYTNVTIEQTATLAAFAYRHLSDANIGMHSMNGAQRTIFHWNFVLTDQRNRVNIIERVYGAKVDQMGSFSAAGAENRWARMLKTVYQDNTRKVLDYVQKLIDEDDKLPLFTPTPSPTPTTPPANTPTPPPENTPEPIVTPPSEEPVAFAEGLPERRAFAVAASVRQYTDAQRAMVRELRTLYDNMRNSKTTTITKLSELQLKAIQVAKEFKYTASHIQTPCLPSQTYVINSPWGLRYYTDKSVNPITVNFN